MKNKFNLIKFTIMDIANIRSRVFRKLLLLSRVNHYNHFLLKVFGVTFFFQIRACVISARKAKNLDVTTMFTYSHANTPLTQSERTYYLSYFIIQIINRTNILSWIVAMGREGRAPRTRPRNLLSGETKIIRQPGHKNHQIKCTQKEKKIPLPMP